MNYHTCLIVYYISLLSNILSYSWPNVLDAAVIPLTYESIKNRKPYKMYLLAKFSFKTLLYAYPQRKDAT